MILEKKIRFNNKNWLVRIGESGVTVQIFLYDENGNINHDFSSSGYAKGETLIDICKNAILEANKIDFKAKDYENLVNWDGNMDKELNII